MRYAAKTLAHAAAMFFFVFCSCNDEVAELKLRKGPCVDLVIKIAQYQSGVFSCEHVGHKLKIVNDTTALCQCPGPEPKE